MIPLDTLGPEDWWDVSDEEDCCLAACWHAALRLAAGLPVVIGWDAAGHVVVEGTR